VRKLFTTIIAGFLLAIAAAPAQACPSTGCGYPSIDRAQTYAIASKVHGYCGHPWDYVCKYPTGWSAICTDNRGLHSLDCQRVDWYNDNLFAGGLATPFCTFGSNSPYSDGVWIRYESDGSLSFHWDGYPAVYPTRGCW
jgi:hypothetical protein